VDGVIKYCDFTVLLIAMCAVLFVTAKEFGCTEFVNPKDYDRPIQQV